MRLIYSIIFYLCLPLVVLKLLWRGRKAPAYRLRWAERFGLVDKTLINSVLINKALINSTSPAKKIVWVHAVSVGETLAAVPLIRRLNALPNTQVLVTCMTPTGSAQVEKIFGDQVLHVYAPYDLPSCVMRFLNRCKPSCLIIMETELWPNTIAACAARSIPVILANGRLSEKSARGYQKIRWLIGPALQQLTCAAMQTRDDAARMMELGLPEKQCVVTGNIKFDLTIDTAIVDNATALRNSINATQKKSVWLAASTHQGEDELVIQAFLQAREKLPALFLLVVPRHPERFNEVAGLCEKAGLIVQRRSNKESIADKTNVLIGDTMGELLMLYGVADLTFVGGSLVPVGGHNLIEPAAWGLPIISGPHLFNFNEVSQLLIKENALRIATNADELAEVVIELGKNKEVGEGMGKCARDIAEANRGALDKLLKLLEPYCC